jgi:hypothetical protein
VDLLELTPAERTAAAAEPERCTAELAECTCPDFCERDHDND